MGRRVLPPIIRVSRRGVAVASSNPYARMFRMDLDRRALLVFNRLRPIYAFKGLRDEQLVEMGRLLERETRAAGETVCAEGQGGEFFYVVERGRVRLTRADSEHQQTLEPGDFFGAEALLGGPLPYTAPAQGEVQLFRLARANFQTLVQENPPCLAGLELAAETREWLFGRRWAWLGANENVSLIIRRHTWLLWQQLFLPIVTAVGVALLAGITLALWKAAAALWRALLLGLPALGWLAWVYVDWGNDCYIVTNQPGG